MWGPASERTSWFRGWGGNESVDEFSRIAIVDEWLTIKGSCLLLAVHYRNNTLHNNEASEKRESALGSPSDNINNGSFLTSALDLCKSSRLRLGMYERVEKGKRGKAAANLITTKKWKAKGKLFREGKNVLFRLVYLLHRPTLCKKSSFIRWQGRECGEWRNKRNFHQMMLQLCALLCCAALSHIRNTKF